MFKDEYKRGNEELAYSYLNAAKCLYMDLQKQNHPDKKLLVFRTGPLVIPFLFLCRHTIELAIKASLDKQKIIYGNTHSINDLLDLNNKKYDIDLDFIKIWDCFDDKGMSLRYDFDLKTKDEYIEKVFFIHSAEIMEETERLVKLLLEK